MITLLAAIAIQLGVASESPYAVNFYAGQANRAPLLELLTLSGSDFQPYSIAAVSASRVLVERNRYLRSEIEGQLVKHLESASLFQINGAILLRWLHFPWDGVLDTSLAAGSGLSLATGIPDVERNTTVDSASPLLHYLMLELAFEIPGTARWGTFARLHHRSGFFGLFNGVWGGSDYLCAGLRYRFR